MDKMDGHPPWTISKHVQTVQSVHPVHFGTRHFEAVDVADRAIDDVVADGQKAGFPAGGADLSFPSRSLSAKLPTQKTVPLNYANEG